MGENKSTCSFHDISVLDKALVWDSIKYNFFNSSRRIVSLACNPGGDVFATSQTNQEKSGVSQDRSKSRLLLWDIKVMKPKVIPALNNFSLFMQNSTWNFW